MKTKLLATASALVLGLASFAATANDTFGYVPAAEWQIYSWQNWSYDFTEVEDSTAVTGADRDQQRIRNNAANIGFKASIDTGLAAGGEAVKANFQCEQFMNPGGFGGSFSPQSDWCNRNSKISLSGAWGEIMWGNWLTPYNEMVAGWIDPFWDADLTSHTSLMGTINSSDYIGPGTNPGTGSGSIGNNGFNKRQSGLTQYWSPNFNGLKFRAATTTGDQGDTEVSDAVGTSKLDPRLLEMGVTFDKALGNGDNVWLAVTYSKHDEWAAVDFQCSDSDDTGLRFAAQYIHQWGGGGSTAIAGMFEQLEYDWEDCAGPTPAGGGAGVGGTGSFVSTGNGSPNLDLEKDTWMVSINHRFGNGWSVNGQYLDADEFDCDVADGCATDNDTDATAMTLGVAFTTSAGTQLALKYAEVDNEDNSRYDTGFYGSGVTGNGQDVTAYSFGVTQAF